ncbi:MAG: DNA polymerase I [Rhodobacteraceae bacterium]|nr:DNA polymerase I [Paracoccaceae bacterium]
MKFGKGHHLHLIDGSAFIFRAYHALPPLTRSSDGLPIGAVSGFCNMLFRYIQNNTGVDAATHAAVIFDHSGKSFRNEIYKDYKANRPPAPEDLVPQFPLTRDATNAFNISCKEVVGFEADDIIATLACQAREAGGRVTIISSDKDLMQLVGDGVEMFDAMKNRRINRDAVVEKFGVNPELVVDVQALAGDSVDNVPGAPGIGVKTAAELINIFGTLENLLDNANEIKQPKRRETLINFADQIRISKQLVKLDCAMKLDFAIDDLVVSPPRIDVLVEFLKKMEFRTILKRVSEQFNVEIAELPPSNKKLNEKNEENIYGPITTKNYETVRSIERLKQWIEDIRYHGYVAFDTETTGLDETKAELVGISLCIKPGYACYIPVGHKEGEPADGLFGSSKLCANQIPIAVATELIGPVLSDPAVLIVGQNIKYDIKILSKYGLAVEAIDDTMLMSYALHGGIHRHSMDTLSEKYLGHTPVSIKSLIGTGKSAITFDFVPIDEASNYAAEDADITIRLWKLFKPKLHLSKVTKVYETLERPLVRVLSDMELLGIKVDRDTLVRMSNSFSQKMAHLEEEIYSLAGETFNVGSPKQLGEILFDKLGYAGGAKGKTGAYSTGADVLADLATEYDLPRKVIDWRQLSKLKSTYTDALQDHINPSSGRVHTSYVSIDSLKKAFRDGLDIHAMTASEMFNVPLDEMTSEIRRQAKAINFGVIYGISGFGLARNLRIPRSDAQAFIDRYFERFPGIKEYMDETIRFAKEKNYVETLFGRIIHTLQINAKGPNAGFAKRAAINAPIQGTAADIIRRAMIRMPTAISHLNAKMLLQVHDELLFEVDQGDVEALISVAKSIMEEASYPAVKLDIPILVDAGHGENWAQAH